MGEQKLLTVREVSLLLGVTEKDVIDYAEQGSIPAYKVGGVYLRFKRDQIEEFKKKLRPSVTQLETVARQYPFQEKVSDFFYFNDFYIISIVFILLIIIVIFRY